MDIIFIDRRLRKICEDWRELVLRYGPLRAKLLRRRLDELHAADSLADLRSLLQERCCELPGDCQGHLYVDLDRPCRLIFDVADDPVPELPTGGSTGPGCDPSGS